MNTETTWNTPTPLRPNRNNLLHFPVKALPPILRETAQAISETTSTDAAMAGTAIISAVSYCFTGVYRMTGKPDHTEPLVVNSLTVAEPSFKKSPVMSFVKQPFVRFAKDWNESNRVEIFRSQAERKILENRLLETEKKEDVTAEEIAEIKTEISGSKYMNFRRIVVDDITPESLVNQLEKNGSLLMISDEAGMLGNFSGRYSSNIPNLDLLLKSWNGETYISDRATRESLVLQRPYVSICLATQPYMFESMMSNTAFRGSGLIARMVYCFPNTNIGHRKYDTKPVPEKVSEMYGRLVYKLLNNKFSYKGENELQLRFDDEAYSLFVDYYNSYIEPMMLKELAFCRDWGGKYHGLIMRLCGIIHCVKCILNGIDPVEKLVETSTFCNAVEIGEYFREQAIYAYSIGDVDMATVKAERVLSKVRSKGIKQIRQNDLYKQCRCTMFSSAKDFDETVEMLEDYGYIHRTELKGTNNKTMTDITVNPNI